MAVFTLKVVNAAGDVKKERVDTDYCDLAFGEEYEQGDCIVLESSEPNIPVKLQVDDALGSAMILLNGNRFVYEVPFGSFRRAHSPKVFSGKVHYIFARTIPEKEWDSYRNLALNVADTHGEAQAFPHIVANCETRGESVFAARNTIDDVTINRSHGRWPFHSWGINMQDDACFKLDFGREIVADMIVLHTRADFPHDNWWESVTFTFSDGSEMVVHLEKSDRPHYIPLENKKFSWFTFDKLVKGDKGEDASLFPALSQIEVFGQNA